jgi:polyisoprenyl-teichoic acid--peptidoglycan teichoic acid transferase
MLKRIFRSKENLSWFLIFALTNLLLIASSGYLIYNLLLLVGVETAIRYAAIVGLIIINGLFLRKSLKLLIKPRTSFKNLLHVIFSFIGLLVFVIAAVIINKTYGVIDKVNKEYITYSTSLITLTDNKVTDIKNVKNSKIGIISDEESIEGYVISQDIIDKYNLDKNNELVTFDSFQELVANLYSGEVDYIFISTNYVIMFKSVEIYQSIGSDTKTIIAQEKKMKKSKVQDDEDIAIDTNKMPDEPFTILLLGVDSEVNGLDKNGSFNGDTLMLITFNPKTLNATVLSIPRDTYVPIACFANQIENKITHSAWSGESCVIKTIQNFTGISIDYYVKVNFKGVVNLVEALGGIEVDVPQKLCAGNSDRGAEICVNAGLQTLNGEQALVVSRDRHHLIDGDIGRGLNQQLVMQGILNKVKTVKSVKTVYSILDNISNNMDTNMTNEQILGFYNIAKTIITKGLNSNNNELIHMQQLFLYGSGQMIYDEGMGLVLYNYIPNKYSLADDVKAMKINLGLEQPTLIKEFAYSPTEPYSYSIIGEGPYTKNNLYTLLPSFIGKSQSYVQNWCNNHNVNVEFVTVSTTDTATGIVINQNYPEAKRVDKIKTLVISVAEKKVVSTKTDCSEKDNLKADVCYVDDFSSSTKAEVELWAKKIANFTIKWEEVEGALYGGATAGTIVDQSIKKIYIEDAKSMTITIVKDEATDTD